MARKGRPKKAEIVRDLYKKTNTFHRRKWYNDSQQSVDFYLNDQLSQAERDALVESGMPDFIINRITPAIDIMKYFVTANNPRWQAVGVDGSDSDIAHLHGTISEYCWHLSNGKSLFGQVIHDALTKGMGIFAISVDTNADKGKGEVRFTSVDPYDVYVDPTSRDIQFRDANYIIIQKNMTKEALKKLMPKYKRKISIASASPEAKQTSNRDKDASYSIQHTDIDFADSYKPDTAERDETVDFYELYERIRVEFVSAVIKTPPTPSEIKAIQMQIEQEMEMNQQEIQVSLMEKQQEIQQAVQEGEMIQERAELEMQKAQQEAEATIQEMQRSLEARLVEAKTSTEQVIVEKAVFDEFMKDDEYASNVIDAVDFSEQRIKLSCVAGDQFLYEQTLEVDNFPIVPICYTHTGTPYPMSAVTPMIGKQQELNKAHQVMLHNANLASNLRFVYTEGSIDEDEWEQYSSAPGALLKHRQGFEPPTIVNPQPINNAFFTITQQGKEDIEHISGVASQMQGVGEPQHETYRGMLALDEYGTRRIRQWTNNVVEPALESLGKVFMQVSQLVYTSNKVFRIVQPEAGQQDSEIQQAEINIPVYNDFGEVIKRWNDYESAKFDIRIVAGSTQPINRWALLDEYFKWFEAGLIDDIAMLGETDIRNKKQIMQRKSLYSQLESTISQLQTTVKDQQGTIQTLQRQVVQSAIKDKVNEADKTIHKATTETTQQQRLIQNIMRSDLQGAKKEQVAKEGEK
tara:strand:- start:32718 stop:34955 length:2238 start_codon:yes stop_codon:yes gene_type:complete